MYIYLYVYSPWTGLQSITGQTHSNSEPSRCEATLLTTTPLCHPPTFVSAVSPTLRMYNCVLEVTAMSVISIVAWRPLAPLPESPFLSAYLCLRLLARLLGSSQASCLLSGTNLGWQARAEAGRTRGVDAPSFCPCCWGHSLSPNHPAPPLLSFPFFPLLPPPASLFRFCQARAFGIGRSRQLTNCCHAWRAKWVGERKSQHHPASRCC